MKERVVYVLIIMTLSILLALSWGNKNNDVADKPLIRDTVLVEVNHYDTIYTPKPYEVIKTVTEVKIDTFLVYNDYFNIVEYKDTVRINNSDSYVYLHEVVSQNRLTRRSVDMYYENTQKHSTSVITKYRNKSNLYLGFKASSDLDLFLNATYKTPNKGIYSVGVNPIDRSVMLGVGFKIF